MQSQVMTLTPDAGLRQRVTRLMGALMLGTALALAPVMSEARGAPDTFADLAQSVSPAVVNITTSAIVSTSTEDMPRLPEGSPFQDFFDEFMNRQGEGEPRRSEALGSGFAYPVTLSQVAKWAESVESRGYQLAPASALASRR